MQVKSGHGITTLRRRTWVVGGAVAGLSLGLPSLTLAAAAVWNGSASTAFDNGGNWTGGTGTGGTVGANDNATFSSALTSNQPSLSASYGPIQGLTFSTATGGWTLNKTGTPALTLSNTGTGATSAINASSTSGTNTIAPDLILSGANSATFTNAAATLTINGRISLSNVDLSANKTLTVTNTGAVNFHGVIQDWTSGPATLGGGGSLFKTNTGSLTLTATNTYKGTTSIDRGTLTLNGTGASAASAFVLGTLGNSLNPLLSIMPTAGGTVTRGASLSVNGQNASTASGRMLQVTGISSSTTDQFTGALNLNTGGTYAQINSNVASTATLRFGSVTRSTGTVLNVINGTASSTVGGSSTSNRAQVLFTSAPTSTMTNGVQLVGGALGTTSAAVLPFVSVNSAGLARLATYDSNGLRPLDVNTEMATLGAGAFSGGQNAKVTASATTAGTTTVNSLFSDTNATLGLGGATLNVTSGAIQSDGGVINTAGNPGLVIGSSVNDGTLNFGSAEGFLHVNAFRLITVNSVIAGSGGLTIDLAFNSGGGSTAVLAGANTYTGKTTITGTTAGSLNARILNPLALQNSTLDYNNYGASFLFGANTITNVANTNVTTATFGGLTGGQGIALVNSGPAGGALALTLGSVGSADTVNTINAYSGILSGTGSIIKAGVSTQVLSGVNTYSGGTQINSGTLQFARTNAMPNSNSVQVSNGGTLAVNAGGSGEWTNASTSTVGSIGGLLAGLGGQTGSTVSFASGASLGIDTTNASGGALTYSGAINNAGLGITKLGTGTLTLSNAANGFTGVTRVRNGTLALTAASGNSNIPSSSAIIVGTNSTESSATLNVAGVTGGFQVKSGQTLGGHGLVTGNSVAINSGATLAPGSSIGQLSITGNLSLAGTSDFEINALTLTSDLANVSAALAYGGTLKITNVGGTLASGQSWNLFDFGSQSGSFANNSVFGTAGDGTNLPNLGSGKKWAFDYTSGVLSIESANPTISLSATTSGSNVATGGQITVTGGSNSYVSEIDELIAPGTASSGYAPIVTIGNEPGTDYILVWTDTNGVPAGLDAGTGTVITGGSLFSSLQGTYPGFDFMVSYANFTGSKNVVFDFTGSGINVDKLAVVPEPASVGLIAMAGLMLGARRRRKA